MPLDESRELPVSADAEVLGAAPEHRQPLLMGLVALGGLVGAAARYGITLVAPTRTGSWPTGTFLINVLGAFVLGLLLEGLARNGPDEGWRRHLRLLAGTGFCGAFTTYSTLAVESDLLVRGHRPGLAVAYGLVSVLAGLVAAAAGVGLAAATVSRAAAGPEER